MVESFGSWLKVLEGAWKFWYRWLNFLKGGRRFWKVVEVFGRWLKVWKVVESFGRWLKVLLSNGSKDVTWVRREMLPPSPALLLNNKVSKNSKQFWDDFHYPIKQGDLKYLSPEICGVIR